MQWEGYGEVVKGRGRCLYQKSGRSSEVGVDCNGFGLGISRGDGADFDRKPPAVNGLGRCAVIRKDSGPKSRGLLSDS